MIEKVRWGVLGTANIAVKKVIPAMRSGRFCTIAAIASRNAEKAGRAAGTLGIPKSYPSYQELLNDPEIEAVYIPLPNHLHVEWAKRAAEAGKHVLCEKPIGLNAAEVRELIKVRDRCGVKIEEAFMVRTHPKWLSVRDLIRSGRIGEVRAITGFFSYFNDDSENIRNKLEMGGGALMDIGCYPINISRFIFEDEPRRVSGLIERDRETGIDKLTSAMLDFPQGHSAFTCSTRLVPYQRMQFFGEKGRIEVQIPFNIPPETPTEIFIDDGEDLYGRNVETIRFDAADQYTIQGDLFSEMIRENSDPAISLEDSFANMAAIEAVFRSAETGDWERPESL
ncbi:MAG: Gfo/Idh/MocA family oxidoreductase [Pyrinomonadaceae bacterium]